MYVVAILCSFKKIKL